MKSDRPQFTVHTNPGTKEQAGSPIVARRSECDPSPFAVPRFDRRTKERILSKTETDILDVIETASEELPAISEQNRARRSRYYIRHLVRLGLNRAVSLRVMAIVQKAAGSEYGWTDQTTQEIIEILCDVPLPVVKSAQPLTELPVEVLQQKYADIGHYTRLLIEGGVSKLVILDPLYREIIRVRVRDGKVHTFDIVQAFESAERKQTQE